MNSRTKNILRNVGFLLSVPVIIGAFVFAVTIEKKEKVLGVEVFVQNPELGFVKERDIKNTLVNANVILNHSITEELDVAALEETINSNPWVETAEVYVTANQNVKVNLKQLVPVLRVQRTDSTSNGYYLDDQGYMIPLSRTFYPDVPILTSERPITTVEQRKELVKLAQYIETDTFWQATIAQINLDKNNDIELVSLIGDANIRFGSTDNMEDKFFRIFQFYKKGINRINWNNVKELDVRFAKQVVCRRYHKENKIEETRAPKLYKKSKTQALAAKPKKVVKKTEPSIVLKRRPIKKRSNVLADEKSNNAVAKKTNSKKKAVKKVTVKRKTTAKKRSPKKKAIAKKKPTAKKKEVAEAPKKKAAVAAPKRKKRKREIIINTEPVTSKKATH